MTLEIDAGNSSLKWRWRGSPASSAASLGELETALGDCGPPREALICSVRGADFEAEANRWFADKWGLQPRFARVVREWGGVRIQYPDPSALGADRWLAMLAGFRLAPGGCLIVDSGTALTIDLLDANGLHLGGYIMPGLETLQSGLLRNTAIRLQPTREKPATAPGNDTASAVRNGAAFMLCSVVRAAVENRAREAGEQPMLILTGGDAAMLQGELGEVNSLLVPELVLDGLGLAHTETQSETLAETQTETSN